MTEKKVYILTDIKVDDPLSEYCSFQKNIDLDFIPKDLDVPVVDVIADRISGKENPILILDQNSENHRKLFTESTKYQNFESVREKIELVIYGKDDVLLQLDNTVKRERELASWINHLRPKIIAPYSKAGAFFMKNYPDCEFINIPALFIYGESCGPHLSTLKKHEPDLDFFFLAIKKEQERPFRGMLYEKIVSNNLLGNSISKFREKDDATFGDLQDDYSKICIEGFGWLDSLPMISYYNRTNFELVAECPPLNNFDDSFYLTEKTIKPIAMLHPFIIFAHHNHLSNLRSLGFRTFGDHIDESYDTEPDVEKRVNKIIENLKTLKGSSDSFYKNTKEIREHNLLTLQHGIGEWRTRFWNRLDEFFNNIG